MGLKKEFEEEKVGQDMKWSVIGRRDIGGTQKGFQQKKVRQDMKRSGIRYSPMDIGGTQKGFEQKKGGIGYEMIRYKAQSKGHCW